MKYKIVILAILFLFGCSVHAAKFCIAPITLGHKLYGQYAEYIVTIDEEKYQVPNHGAVQVSKIKMNKNMKVITLDRDKKAVESFTLKIRKN